MKYNSYYSLYRGSSKYTFPIYCFVCLQLDEQAEGRVHLYHIKDKKKRPIMLVAKDQLAMGCKLLPVICLEWFRPV